jgi:hypothetical protein
MVMFALFISFCLAFLPNDEEVRQLIERISQENIRNHLQVLAHDSLEGRGTGSRGESIAARYIAEKLQSYGITPLGEDGSFFQPFPLHGSLPLDQSQLTLFESENAITLKLWKDYILYNTGGQTFIPLPLQLVFVGYGILAPEYDYNDYRQLNVENKIVVFLSGEPVSSDSDYFDGERPTIYSDPTMKFRIALSRGARGSIMIPLPREGRFVDWDYWLTQFSFEDIRSPYGISDNLNVLLNYQKADFLFKASQFELADVLAFDSKGGMQSFPLNVSASFIGKFRERDFVVENVAGVLRGSDALLKDSYLIISAHYDHLGVGVPAKGDSIYNGAVDNAIGVAATLELARVFSILPAVPSRSIIFLFVTGEEKGLLGSRHYCDQPLVPLHKTVANLNVDGLAIFDQFNSISGVGAELSTLGELLKLAAEKMELSVSPIPPQFLEKEPFYSSDQFSFAQAGIPAILVMEGIDYKTTPAAEGLKRFVEWGRTVYHSPFDDSNQTINYEAARQHLQLLLVFANVIANSFIPPQWNPGSRYITPRLQSMAEGR